MRITDVQTVPISVPSRPVKSSLGTFNTHDYGIVIVNTDEDVSGIGEISMLWDGTGHMQCHYVSQYFGPLLVGEDPTAINRCLRKMDTVVEAAWPARAAVEMALYDISGKILDTPVYNLLGGRSRETIVLSRSIYMAPPEEMAKEAAEAIYEGYECVKVKVGRSSEADLDRVAAVREAIGAGAILRIDANMGWGTPKVAIRNIKMLEPYDLHSVEQPLPPGSISDLRLIRESVATPVMVDESLWGPQDAWEILCAKAADFLNVYVAESGGLTNASLIFRMAETAGVPCVIGSMPELGVGTAAALHLGAAMTNLNDPADACGTSYHDVDVIQEEFEIRNGKIAPPDGAGLGVTLDDDAIQRYRVDN